MTPERLSWALLAFPLLVSIRLTSRIELLCLLLLVVLSLLGKPRRGDGLRRYLPTALLVLCAGMSLLRGAPTKEATGLALTVVAVVLATRRCTSSVAVHSLVAGISIYLWANILGWAVGIQSPAASVRVGELDGRVILPFVRSLNEPAVVSAALLAFVVVSWRRKQRVSRIAWFGVPAAVVVTALSGSRFPVIVLVLIVPAVLVLPWVARLVPIAALAAISVPFVLTAVTPLIDAMSSSISGVPYLDRDQTVAQLAGGSSRVHFWDIGLKFWDVVVTGWSDNLFGFGYDGHVQSHVVYLYYTQGGFVNDPAALTLHNTFLQQMYDTGYVGLAALIAALAIIGMRFARAGALASSAMIGVLYATSAIEVFLVPSFRFLPFLMVLALSPLLPGQKRPQTDDADGVPVELHLGVDDNAVPGPANLRATGGAR